MFIQPCVCRYTPSPALSLLGLREPVRSLQLPCMIPEQVCQQIPAGRVSTYGALAKVLHSSPRAVGQVCTSSQQCAWFAVWEILWGLLCLPFAGLKPPCCGCSHIFSGAYDMSKLTAV